MRGKAERVARPAHQGLLGQSSLNFNQVIGSVNALIHVAILLSVVQCHRTE